MLSAGLNGSCSTRGMGLAFEPPHSDEQPLSCLISKRVDVPGGLWPLSPRVTQPLLSVGVWRGRWRELAHSGEPGSPLKSLLSVLMPFSECFLPCLALPSPQ